MKKFYFREEYRKAKEDEENKYDFGIVELEEEMEEIYGYLGIDTRSENAEGVEKIEVCGYPEEKKMWSSVGPYKKATENFLFYKLSTETGQSGSPIIKEEGGKMFIIGVHIGGFKKKNFAIKLTTQKRKIINEWVAEITGVLNLGKLVFI